MPLWGEGSRRAGAEQAAAEAETLELRPQIELVDLAVVGEAAGRGLRPVVRVAGRRLSPKHQDGDAAALADRTFPPFGAAPVDQLVELGTGDDRANRRSAKPRP